MDNTMTIVTSGELSAEVLEAYLRQGLRVVKANPLGLVLIFGQTDKDTGVLYDYRESKINEKDDDV